ncbi:MAG: site-2 protease family protein [Acidimicrobiales bacterium]
MNGIPIRVHWSFAGLIVLVVALTAGSGIATVLAALGWLVLLFASVVVHELAHGLVARRRGLVVLDIVLLPIGGVSEIPELTRSAEDELRIALAGPIASLGLALLFGIFGFVTGAALWPPTLVSGSILVRLAWMNLVLAGFNLVPALPMDGGRVLRAVLARHRGDLRATTAATLVAKVLGLGMIVIGVFVDVWLVLIGIFVLLGAQAESRASRTRATFGDHTVGDLTVPAPYTLPGAMPVGEVFRRYPPYPWPAIPVEGPGGYVGMITHASLMAAAPDEAVGHIADPSVPLLDPQSPLFPAAVAAFNLAGGPVLPVGTGGRVRGLIAAADMEAFLARGSLAAR